MEGGYPWLAFYDKKLLLDELYFLRTNKNLVVLSACKTSEGEYKKGEGIFSISRSFINSGARSVVSTLWDVNEKSNAEIISAFYKNLFEGQSKTTSLRKAKLNYINKHQNTSLASPYFWSPIILSGETLPIKRRFPKSIFFLLFFISGLIIFFRNRIRKVLQKL